MGAAGQLVRNYVEREAVRKRISVRAVCPRRYKRDRTSFLSIGRLSHRRSNRRRSSYREFSVAAGWVELIAADLDLVRDKFPEHSRYVCKPARDRVVAAGRYGEDVGPALASSTVARLLRQPRARHDLPVRLHKGTE